MENKVSIIINDTRYDAVDNASSKWCEGCELFDFCEEYEPFSSCLCSDVFGTKLVFKKSAKSFES